MVAFPLMRQVSVSWFLNWTKMDKTPVVAQVATEEMYLPTAMQTLVDMAFRNCPDFDRIVVYEHDMLPPLDALTRIAEYADDRDIVGTLYFKREYPFHVQAWMQIVAPYFAPLTREAVKAMVDDPDLYEVDAVAMGFTAIHRRVFEHWDPEIPMWDPEPVGHDLHFCHEAKQRGFGIWLDSGIECGHLMTRSIGFHHQQEALAT